MIVLTPDMKIRAGQILRKGRKDWPYFAKKALGANLDPEQEAILRSVQINPKTTVKSGTARGKDFVAAVAAACFLYLTPKFDKKDVNKLVLNTKVALTAPTDRQVAKIMMPEVARLYHNLVANGFGFIAGNLQAYDIKTEFEEWFLTGFKADETRHEAWSGFHAANTMFVVTEASGISDNIFNAIEGNLQGNSRLLIVFNDNTGAGYAANSQKKPGWAKFRLDSLTAPNVLQRKIIIPGQVDWTWVNDRVNDWCTIISEDDYKDEEGDFFWENEKGKLCYRPNDLFRVKVRGLAPKVSSGSLVPIEWIEAAVERWKLQQSQKWKIDHPLRLGVDVAGMGRDSSCFCKRYGHYVAGFEMIHSGGTANHMEVAGRCLNLLKLDTDAFIGKTAQAFIDTIGEGAGVFSRLVELSETKAHAWLKGRVHSIKFSESAEWHGLDLLDYTKQYKFFNMRAYLYWAVRDWLNPMNKTNAMLPPDEYLSQELTETQWAFRSDGSIQLEKKEDLIKRIGRSPDKSDALVNTFAPQADIVTAAAKKQDLGRIFF